MLQTKFQGHRSIGCGGESFFFQIFTIYGHTGHVGHVIHFICINLHSHSPVRFHMNFGSKSPN